ncbi:hypothetical protein RG565_07070 [Streptococcus sp. IsoGale021]|uniref:hypothetical protein n=1 Tax=Streptococcus TaxID=1301 RepID=UPI002001BFE8|nr:MULTISPECIES: hypothetical protein [Streptococcus]MCY7211091.1 hypothetical protein [Streptococcus anginosus]MCY7211832.1 hypothetical protein [Streptococcus anginosus]MCY7227178.1 hypothetical protein [Streptococcus anginosus]MDQ8695080.1 hypothetical protein [Streptococcus sp. IsoGale021]MEE0846808.1 hypothetical protein [Streptococcus anginosus]
MFANLLNYYIKNAQTRINERIEVINKKRSALRSSGSSLYSDLKPIRNSHLYKHKPKTIKVIRESDPDQLYTKMTVRVAESMLENIKLKPNFKSYSSNKDEELEMRKNNFEFNSLQEIFWGVGESYTDSDKFNFVLNLFLDLSNHPVYSSMTYSILIDYVPLARYKALDKAIDEDQEFGSMFAPDYKNANVDVFAEAVYLFCMNNKSDEMMERFIKFLNTEYKYESKDQNGHFLWKSDIIHFQNFNEAFQKKLKDILEPILNIEMHQSLGKRAYDIVLDDFKITSKLMEISMVRGPEEYGRHLTMAEKNDVDVMSVLLSASEIYIDKLIEAQQDIFGDIEEKYFNSELFLSSGTPYYSEARLHQLVQQKRKKELEKDLDFEPELNSLEY